MTYYATVTSNNTIGSWAILTAITLLGAKRQANKVYGMGYLGDVIKVAALAEGEDVGLLNDRVVYTHVIS